MIDKYFEPEVYWCNYEKQVVWACPAGESSKCLECKWFPKACDYWGFYWIEEIGKLKELL